MAPDVPPETHPHFLWDFSFPKSVFIWFNRLSMSDSWLARQEEPEGRKGQSSEPWRLALVILCSAPSLTRGTWHVWRRLRRAAPALRLIQPPVGVAPRAQTYPLTTSSMCGRSQTAAALNMKMETGNKSVSVWSISFYARGRAVKGRNNASLEINMLHHSILNHVFVF